MKEKKGEERYKEGEVEIKREEGRWMDRKGEREKRMEMEMKRKEGGEG